MNIDQIETSLRTMEPAEGQRVVDTYILDSPYNPVLFEELIEKLGEEFPDKYFWSDSTSHFQGIRECLKIYCERRIQN